MSISGILDKNMNLLDNSVNFRTGQILDYKVFISLRPVLIMTQEDVDIDCESF